MDYKIKREDMLNYFKKFSMDQLEDRKHIFKKFVKVENWDRIIYHLMDEFWICYIIVYDGQLFIEDRFDKSEASYYDFIKYN